jgi:hypothetical protein
MHFNTRSNDKKLSICKKCIIIVYVKLNDASNGVSIDFYFRKSVELYLMKGHIF